MSLPRDLTTTTESHLTALIADQTVEGAYLEFKRDAPGKDSSAKHELTADVSAFANSAGGDIVYGMDEDSEGRASRLAPLQGNIDEIARWFQDVLMTGIEPRIPGVQLQPVSTAEGYVLVVRVPASWAGPHRVKSNQHFFVRENGRKRQLDVPEIRGLFLRSEGQADRVRDFRTERLGKLLAGESPQRLVPGALLVGHFVPTQSALGLVQVDPVVYAYERYLPILGASASSARLNVDGALVYRSSNKEGTHGYSQLFRNGYFETVRVMTWGTSGKASLGNPTYESDFINLLKKLRIEYEFLGVGKEMTCMLSILRARNVLLGLDAGRYNLDDHQGEFDRETVIIPDVTLPADVSEQEALHPVFDLVWQAAGMLASGNYAENGTWQPPR